MAVINFKEEFQSRYQDILRKTLVSFKVANTRFQSDLSYGDTVHRFKLDLSGIIIRDVVRYVDQTIDSLADTDQMIVIDQQKGAAFAIHDWDKLQAGPLNPGMIAGKEVAFKMRTYIDASVFNEVRNAQSAFDAGDLTTLVSTNLPIDTSVSANIPLLATRAFAKLQSANAPMNDWIWVIDPYMAANMAAHVIGKNINLSGDMLQNGWSGDFFGSQVYITNNLTGEGRLVVGNTPANGETVTLNGVVFTYNTTLGGAGSVLIGANAAAARANLISAINGTAGAGSTYTALATANRNILTAARITAYDYNATVASTVQVIGIGSGRLSTAETLAGSGDTWSYVFVHSYFGARNQIDLVVQDDPSPLITQEPKQATKNVLVNALYGLKTFDDAKIYFLDVKAF